jgi:hypothetical protein
VPLEVTPALVGGREHDVKFDDASKRWVKFTKPSGAGYAVEMVSGRLLMTNATPLQYLERWRLHNRLFYNAVELLGLRTEGPEHRIVISQKDFGAGLRVGAAADPSGAWGVRSTGLPARPVCSL